MRILLVTDSFAPATDASAEIAHEVCQALLAAGHEVLVVTATPGKGTFRTAEVLRTRTPLPAPLSRALPATLPTALPPGAAQRALWVRAVDFDPDLVHVLRPRALGAAALRALEHLDVPVVTLDPTPFTPRVGTALSSTAAGARLLGMVGVQARVWSPGVRAEEYHPRLRSPELHAIWARGGSHTVVGYAGPVGPSTTKHVRRLASVATLDGVRLVVLGRGPGTPTLKHAGARIVGACGSLELARALASLDLYVQPRKHADGLSAFRKALASGVPVVAFDSATTAEVVTDGHNGLLVPPARGRTGLAEAVALLSADRDLRASLAAHARDSVTGRTWTDAVAELIDLGRPAVAAAG